MYHYVYRITSIIENKHYYGKRSSKIEPKLDLGIRYFSSSKDKEFIKDQKQNSQNYKYKIVSLHTSSKEALNKEIRLHNKFNVQNNLNFINIAKQTSTGFTTEGKISAINILTNETSLVSKESFCKEDYFKGVAFGNKMSEEHKQIISKANKHRSLTEEHKRNIGIANKGKPMTEKTKIAFDKQRSLPKSQKTIEKLKASLKGRIFTEEHKQKISNALKGKPNPCTKTKEQLKEMAEKRAKKVNIYCYHTNNLIASNVVMAWWAKENGYDAPQLGKTLKRNLDLPKSSTNIYQHKGIYAMRENNNEA